MKKNVEDIVFPAKGSLTSRIYGATAIVFFVAFLVLVAYYAVELEVFTDAEATHKQPVPSYRFTPYPYDREEKIPGTADLQYSTTGVMAQNHQLRPKNVVNQHVIWYSVKRKTG